MQQPKLRFKEYQNGQLVPIEFKDLMEPGTYGIKRGPFGGALKKEIFVKDGFAVYEQQHAIYKDFENIRYFIKEEKYNELISFKIEAGDLIMSCSGTIGKIAVFPEEARPGVINQALIRFRADKNKVDSKFLYHLLNSEYMQKKMLSINPGSAIKNLIAVPELKKIKINLFNIHEQKKIASFLTLLSKKIEKQLEKVEKLEQLKKGMMQKIFSHELRFKDEDSGEFPQWRRTTLKGEVDIFNNMRKPVTENIRQKGKYPYYGATGIIDYVQDYIFDGEYLLLAEDGANIVTRSAPVVYKTKDKFWVNNHAHIMKPKANNDFNFFYQVLENINYIPYNSGTAQPKLNVESIKKIPLKIPIHDEQRKVGMFLLTVDSKIEKEKEKLMVLEEQKKGFMQRIFI